MHSVWKFLMIMPDHDLSHHGENLILAYLTGPCDLLVEKKEKRL